MAALPPTMSCQRAGDVVAWIDACSPGDVIATDCDGTLWSGDVGDALAALACERPALFVGRSAPALTDYSAYEAMLHGDYTAACLASAAQLCGVAPAAVAAALHARLVGALMPRRWLVDALQDAQGRGVRVVAVSASARLAVDVGLAIIGMTPQAVIAVEVDDRGPIAPWPIDIGKVDALQRRGERKVAVAIGDTVYDQPMLRYASRGALLEPVADDAFARRSAAAVRGAARAQGSAP